MADIALGIGLSHQVVIEGMLHLSFDKPARHMRALLKDLATRTSSTRAHSQGSSLFKVAGAW